MALTAIPTKVDGDLGRVKSDDPAYVAPVDLDIMVIAAEHEAIKTAIINIATSVGVDDGSTSGSLRANASDIPELIFKWNKTDITQFDASTPQYSDGGGTHTLSVVTVTGRGTALRIAGSGGATMTAIFLVTAPITWADDRRDIDIEMEVADMVPGTGGYAGYALCDLTGGVHALIHLPFGGAEWAARVDAGAAALTSGGTGNGMGNGGMMRATIRGTLVAGAPLQLSSYLQDGSTLSANRRTGATANIYGNTQTRVFGDGTVEPASWNDLPIDRFGICIKSSGGNAAPTSFDILDLRVYRRAR